MAGLFILSLDTEIAWGTYGAKRLSQASDCFNNYRQFFPRLISLLDQYDIKTTFAVVGHLFLDSCSGHDDLPQPHYAWMPSPDSYRDPCSDLRRAPWYYGPDIIAQIRGAKTAHEIGTHTFTHVIAADPAVTPSIWEAQLNACAAIHAQHDLPMLSLVYPQNRIAYRESLSEHGIIAFRGNERRWYHDLPRVARRACHLIDRALAFTPPTYNPATLLVSERLVDLPSSQFLMAYDGVRRYIPTSARVQQATRGLQRAAQHDELFHLWFHPFNLGTSDEMFVALEAILREVARLREAGVMRVMTMAEAAQWILDGMPGDQREPHLPEEAWA